MKRIVMLFICVLFFSYGWAQQPSSSSTTGIRIYGLSMYEKYDYREILYGTQNLGFTLEPSNRRILHPSFAFLWKAGSNSFHEIELTWIEINKTESKTIFYIPDYSSSGFIDGMVITRNMISLRYEYILAINNPDDKKMKVSFGAGINPFYSDIHQEHFISNRFPTQERNIGAHFQITPRVNYFISEKFFFDLNVPLSLLTVRNTLFHKQDPGLTTENARRNFTSAKLFPQYYSLRIGVGLMVD